MPSRKNTDAEIGNYQETSDARDRDNIFLTDEGWVYRHYKNDQLTRWWDEVIVAGEVPDAIVGGVANAPVDSINDAEADITFVATRSDNRPDVMYSPDWAGVGPRTGGSGGLATATIDSVTVSHTGGDLDVGIPATFAAAITFTPDEDHPDATLEDLNIEYHWNHDGEDDDDHTGASTDYSFNSVGFHKVAVVITGGQLDNPAESGEETFHVYGTATGLSINVDPNSFQAGVEKDINVALKTSVKALAGRSTDIDITSVEIVSDVVQSDWYTITNTTNTIKLTPNFGGPFKLKITATHPDVRDPIIEEIDCVCKAFWNVKNYRIVTEQVDGEDGTLGNYTNADLTYYNTSGTLSVHGHGWTENYTLLMEATGFGYDGNIPPERVPHQWKGISDQYVNDSQVNLDETHNSGKDVKLTNLLVSDYVTYQVEGQSERDFHVHSHSVDPGDWHGEQAMYNFEYLQAKKLYMKHSGNWSPQEMAVEGTQKNVIVYIPSNIKTLRLTLDYTNEAYISRSARIGIHDANDWSRVEVKQSYLVEGGFVMNKEDDDAYYDFVVLDLDAYRSAGKNTIRLSGGVKDGNIFDNNRWQNLMEDTSHYFMLLP